MYHHRPGHRAAAPQHKLDRVESAEEGDILYNIVVFLLHWGEYINTEQERTTRRPACDLVWNLHEFEQEICPSLQSHALSKTMESPETEQNQLRRSSRKKCLRTNVG
jgi:hypothetical protein